MDLRKLLVSLIVLSTIAFTVGTLIERSNADTHRETGHEQPGHVETGEEGEGSEEPASSGGESGESASDEELFGIDPESTALLIVAILVSALLAAGCWFRPEWRWLLGLTALAMAAFAVLDAREVVHQFDESRTGLGVLAAVVAVLHAAAAIAALVLLARGG